MIFATDRTRTARGKHYSDYCQPLPARAVLLAAAAARWSIKDIMVPLSFFQFSSHYKKSSVILSIKMIEPSDSI
jgi:hypothetical protein